MGVEVDLIAGFRSKDIIILEDEMKNACTNLHIVTDDGSNGRKALVTQVLKELIDAGNQYDAVIAIGPMIMMKFVCETTRPVRHQDHRFHEHHHGRRYRHVRRLPSDRRRRDQVRLR